MKTVRIQYFADVSGTVLTHEYDTKEIADEDTLREWEEWMADSATEHPEEPDAYEVFDVVAK